MRRFIPTKAWTRKPKARHFRIRDESKARTAEKKWLAKSKARANDREAVRGASVPHQQDTELR